MVFRLLAVCTLAAVVFAKPPAEPAEAKKPAEKNAVTEVAVNQMVFFAVLEGLYTDGVSNEVVDLILHIDPKTKAPRFNEHFVDHCPLCHPAFDAFVLYRSRPSFSLARKDGRNDTFGCGLGPGIVAQLKSAERADRRAAIQTLVTTWVSRRLESMRLTAEEREEWAKGIEEGRRQGMGFLRQYQGGGPKGPYADWKGCPVCDGTAGACKKPR
jgi:hypothetical protein